MIKARHIITEAFLEKMRAEGGIARASRLLSQDLPQYIGIPKMSTWSLICEEMVDTEHETEYWLRVAAELTRRGLHDEELEKMRMFAWRTAGWLNFERLLLNWIGLDEEDIRTALVLQFQEGEINEQTLSESLEFLSKYE